MVRDTAIAFYYDPRVKYSVNVLIAAIDKIKIADAYIFESYNSFSSGIAFLRKKYRKCIIAFSIHTYMLANDVFLDFITSINNIYREKCVKIVGGPHASGDPIGSVTSLGFNYAFIGEAEKSIQDFIIALNNNSDPLSVRGVFTVIDGKHVFTGRPAPIDLNAYPPFPYWRLLFNPIEITRGCPYGCKYCQVSYMHGFSMRHRSIENILRYLGYPVRYGIKDLRFISPDSLAYGLVRDSREPNLEVVEELLEKIYKEYVVKHGSRIFYGTFPSEVRPEHLTADAARILRRYVHNKDIIIGAQSGSNRVLREIGRKHTIEDVFQAVDNALRYGFRPNVDFIAGLPGETEEDLVQTLQAVKKLAELGARIHMHVFLPLPGTPYAYKKPAPVPDWFKKEIMRLIGKGKVYGQWLHQEKLRNKLLELRRKGIIMPYRKTFSPDRSSARFQH